LLNITRAVIQNGDEAFLGQRGMAYYHRDTLAASAAVVVFDEVPELLETNANFG